MRNDEHFKEPRSQLGVIENVTILVCKGRLGNSNLEIGSKHPILLPKHCKFTELIVEDCHRRVGHSGLKATLAEVRSKYWIPRGRQYIKRILSRCGPCIRAQGKAFASPAYAALPDFRVQDVHPFTNVGVDFAGPLYFKTKSGDIEKCYIVLYTCCTSRALHVDLIQDLSGPTSSIQTTLKHSNLLQIF